MKLTEQQQIDIVQLCQNAYNGKTGEVKELDNVTSVKKFDIENIEGYACIYDNIPTVIFAGSNEDADWANNTDVTFKKLENGCVHRGFLRAALMVRDVVEDLLEELGTSPQLIIAGHSFGGGIAGCIVDKLFRDYDYRQKTLVLVGSPRFCDARYAKYLSELICSDIYRIWYGEDPVEKTPFITMGYSHVHGDNVYEKHYNPTWFFWLWFAPIAVIFSRYDHHPLRLLAAMRGECIPTDKELRNLTRK